MEHAQEAIEEFHARPAKKRGRTWWGHHLSFSGAECHIKCITSSCKGNKGYILPRDCIMRRGNYIRQIGLSNGIGQMELFCVGSNQNRTPTLGLRKLDPERGGKQGELARTCTCLKVHPRWLVGSGGQRGKSWPCARTLSCSLGLGFGKPRCYFSYLDKQTF